MAAAAAADEATLAIAADLLDRLEVLGLSGGLTEDDFIGDAVREPLCTCLSALSARLAALHHAPLAAGGAELQLVADPHALSAAITGLTAAASSQRSASSGRLNAALARLAAAIEPLPAAAAIGSAGSSSKSSRSRAQCVEIAVAHLHAGALLAHEQPQQQQQQQQQQPAAQPPEPPAAAAAAAAAAEGGDMEVDASADVAAAVQLRQIARLLGVDELAGSAKQLLSAVLPQLQQLMSGLPPTFFQPLVSMEGLQPAEAATLQEVNAALRAEYTVRRRMLIERIKVTLQSFLASPRLASSPATRDEVTALITRLEAQLVPEPGVDLASLAATAAADLAGVMRRATAGEGGSIDASVKRVIIGKVPDRGGRPDGRSCAASMPDWAPRKDTGGGGGGGRDGGGGGRGRGGGGKGRGGGRGGGGRKGGWGRH